LPPAAELALRAVVECELDPQAAASSVDAAVAAL
jgi:hypothetical protein